MLIQNISISQRKGDFYIEDNKIRDYNRDMRPMTIEPVSGARLDAILLDILNLNVADNDGIVSFYNEYGVFGVPYNSTTLDDSGYFNGETQPRPDSEFLGSFYYEDLHAFIYHVNSIKTILKLKEHAERQNFEETAEYFYSLITEKIEREVFEKDIFYEQKEIYELLIRYDDFESLFKDLSDESDDDCNSADGIYDFCLSDFIPYLIERQLKELTPNLKYSYKTRSYRSSAVAVSVKTAAYYALFSTLSENAEIRVCANPKCGKYFKIKGNDKRKIYCSTRCAILQAKRMERERNKNTPEG